MRELLELMNQYPWTCVLVFLAAVVLIEEVGSALARVLYAARGKAE